MNGIDVWSENIAKFEQLFHRNEERDVSVWVEPSRRFPVYESIDTDARFFRDYTFIPDEKILQISPLQYIRPSPFIHSDFNPEHFLWFRRQPEEWPLALSVMEKKVDAIAKTRLNRHVILMQSFGDLRKDFSGPTCMAMILLDRGIPLNGDFIRDRSLMLCTIPELCKHQEYAFVDTKLMDKVNPISILKACLDQRQSGILFVVTERGGRKYIVLDSISVEQGTADIRDAYHGWALTISLETLRALLDKESTFTQILGPVNQVEPSEEKEAPPPPYPADVAAPYPRGDLPPCYSNPPAYNKPYDAAFHSGPAPSFSEPY